MLVWTPETGLFENRPLVDRLTVSYHPETITVCSQYSAGQASEDSQLA